MDNILKMLGHMVDHYNSSSSVMAASSTFVDRLPNLAIEDPHEDLVASHEELEYDELTPSQLCGHSMKTDPIVITTRFYVAGLSVAITSGLGILSNIISLVTLASMSKRGLFIKLLLALTTFDLLFLINGGLFMLQQAFSFTNTVYNTLFPKLIYPLAGFSMTASTYTCLAIALERYLGICRAQSDNSFVVRKARYYVIGILLISTIIDLPRFFELTTTLDKDGNIAGFIYTKLRNDPVYITAYTLWFRLLVTAALPFILMVFFNLRILIYFKRNSFVLNQAHLTSSPDLEGANNTANARTNNSTATQHNQERALYITFFCLTTTFLLCHTPRIVLNIYEVPMSIERDICMKKYNRHYFQPLWVLILAYFEKLALILNSSINFIFYCLAGKVFRQQMYKIIFSKVMTICLFVSEVLSTDRHSEGYAAMETRRNNNSGNYERNGQLSDNMNTGTATATMDTGLVTNTSITETNSSDNNSRYYRMKFQKQMKSFDDHNRAVSDLSTIKETVAIVEPPKMELGVRCMPVNAWLVGSHPNLLLTVSMPYGSFLGHGTPLSKSQPNLKVTLSLSNNSSNDEDEHVAAATAVVVPNKSADRRKDCVNKSTSCLHMDEEDRDEDFDTDDEDTVSSCSAGTNSSCGSSFDGSCPHCVIMISRTKDTDTASGPDNDKEVFV